MDLCCPVSHWCPVAHWSLYPILPWQGLGLNRRTHCTTAKDKKKLESIQNRAARLVFSTGRRSHAMPLLTELHWLPLPYRIDFKICLIVFTIVNNCAPQYLINMLTLYKPVSNLRSSHDQTQLVVPRFNLSLSGQCFSIYAPKVWNELPSSIRGSSISCRI